MHGWHLHGGGTHGFEVVVGGALKGSRDKIEHRWFACKNQTYSDTIVQSQFSAPFSQHQGAKSSGILSGQSGASVVVVVAIEQNL